MANGNGADGDDSNLGSLLLIVVASVAAFIIGRLLTGESDTDEIAGRAAGLVPGGEELVEGASPENIFVVPRPDQSGDGSGGSLVAEPSTTLPTVKGSFQEWLEQHGDVTAETRETPQGTVTRSLAATVRGDDPIPVGPTGGDDSGSEERRRDRDPGSEEGSVSRAREDDADRITTAFDPSMEPESSTTITSSGDPEIDRFIEANKNTSVFSGVAGE